MERSVLIIDDEPLICMGLLELIDWKKYGFNKTDICFNFPDGIKNALRYPYTLIITDIRIHDNNGLEIVRAVRESGIKSKIILISAFAEFDYAMDGIRYGVDNYLLKPLGKEDLENSIEKLFPGQEEQCMPGFMEEAVTVRQKKKEVEEESGFQRAADIDKFLAYIHENYNNPEISLTLFANKTYVNPSYLGQKFRQRTGLKFTDYLNQYRIIKACELLLDDRYLTYEVSEKVGFGNATYFHRMFKKVTGYGTEEFKRKIESGKICLPTMQSLEKS